MIVRDALHPCKLHDVQVKVEIQVSEIVSSWITDKRIYQR